MSLDYRTKFFDDQLRFGSGSNINADDVPNGTTNVWLTNTLQAISGSKIFADEITVETSGSSFSDSKIVGTLDLVNHKITSVTDPTDDQDVATKKYVDDTSGSIGTDLHSYGYTTKSYVDTVSGSIGEDLNHQVFNTRAYVDTVSGSIGEDLNHQVLDLYEYVDSKSGSSSDTLDDVCDRGSTTDQNITAATLRSNSHLYANYDGPNGTSYIYFYRGGSNVGAHFGWNETDQGFVMSHYLTMASHKIINVTDPTNDQDVATKKYVDTNPAQGSVGTLQQVTNNGNTTTQDITAANLKSNGHLYLNNNGPNANAFIYYYNAGSSTGAHWGWSNSYQGWESTHRLFIWGDFQLRGDIYVNSKGSYSDGIVYFYANSLQTGAHFMYDGSESSFSLSHALDMSSHKITSVTDPTSNQDVATKKYVDDNVGSSTDTLDDVCDRGSTTDQSITVNGSGSLFRTLSILEDTYIGGQLDLGSDKIINVTDPTDDQDAATKKYVDDTSGSIGEDLNHQVLDLYEYVDDNTGSSTDTLDDVCDRGSTTDRDITAANLKSNGHLYLNYNGGNGDAFIYYYNGSPTGAHWGWSNSYQGWETTHRLLVYGDFSLRGDIYVNSKGSYADSIIYFYANGSSTGADFRWDGSESRFSLSHALDMSSHKITSVTDPTSNQDAATKKYVDDNTGANTSATLDDVCDNGATTDKGITAASLRSNGSLHMNYNGPDQNTYISVSYTHLTLPTICSV